jgi:hypothetical protein
VNITEGQVMVTEFSSLLRTPLTNIFLITVYSNSIAYSAVAVLGSIKTTLEYIVDVNDVINGDW